MPLATPRFGSSGGPAATGSGVYNSGTLTLANDTVTENSFTTAQYAFGGGIYNAGTMTIYDSTVDDNNASYTGGGIYNNGTLSVTNSTIANNYGYIGTGGIQNNGSLDLTNSTITGNSSTYSVGGISAGGTVTMINTIVANNTSNYGPQDISGNVTAYNSMIGNTNGGNIAGTGNILNSSVGVATALASNGGPTQTVAISSNSPAIQAGGPVTTAAQNINAGDTTIYVQDAAVIAQTGSGYSIPITIGTDELIVTAVDTSANTLTVWQPARSEATRAASV